MQMMDAGAGTGGYSFTLTGNDGKPRRGWQTIEELKQWAMAERKMWNFLQRFTSAPRGKGQAVYSVYDHFFQQLSVHVEEIAKAKTPTDAEDQQRNLINFLKSKPESQPKFSFDPEGALALRLHDEIGPEAGHGAISYSVYRSIDPTALADGKTFSGFLIAAQCSHPRGSGARGLLSGLRRAFESIQSQFQDLASKQKDGIEASRTELEQLQIEKRTCVETWERDRSAMDAEWKALRATFIEELRLKGPMEYWRSKAKGHQWSGFALAVGIGVLSLMTLASVAGVFAYLVWQHQGQDYWQVAPAALFVAIMLYLIRVMVRVYSSHLHLESDAHQRAVMIETFLAFTKDDANVPAEQRKALFEAIFRPVTMGVVKEDPTPNPLSSISNVLHPQE